MSVKQLPAIRFIAFSVIAHLLIAGFMLLLEPWRHNMPVAQPQRSHSIINVTALPAAVVLPHSPAQANKLTSTMNNKRAVHPTIAPSVTTPKPVRQESSDLSNSSHHLIQAKAAERKDAAQKKVTKQTALTPANTPLLSQPQARLDTASILAKAASRVHERALSSSELATLRQSLESRAQSSDVTRSVKVNATAKRLDGNVHPDVLTRDDDGKQLVKVGKDSCAIAEVGADLRKDIHSIRNVPCPDSQSDAALYERIMAEIGKH